MANLERVPTNNSEQEHSAQELAKVGAERHEELRQHLEKSGEQLELDIGQNDEACMIRMSTRVPLDEWSAYQMPCHSP